MFALWAHRYYQLLFVLCTLNGVATAAPKFTMTGPVLSFTLRDPFATSDSRTTAGSATSSASEGSGVGISSGQSSISLSDTTLRVTSLSNVDPCCTWSIHSKGPPFPLKIPSIQSISASFAYQYNQLKALPSTVSGKINLGGFFKDRIKVQIQQSLEVKSGQSNLKIHVSTENENHMCWIKAITKTGGLRLDQIQTSHKFPLPFAAMNSVTINPSLDFQKARPSCLLSGMSGSGRTATIVDLNMEEPTLSVVHALDDRNIISPELSLYSAKIMYNWDVKLNSGSIRTKVDPTSSIRITWTDKTANGEWVTDFHLPLVGVEGPLAADIKVRRQIVF